MKRITRVLGICVLVMMFGFVQIACEGPMGPQGLQGEQGDKGDKGDRGDKGDKGDNGISIIWKGELSTAPAGAQINWAYFNTTLGNAYIYNGTSWDILAQHGAGIVWQGEKTNHPADPQLNWAYYNSTDNKSYIWDGEEWQIITQDGIIGPQGQKGDKGDPGLIIERVYFTDLTANGDDDNTTTRLTLTFDMDIPGLNSNDITIIDHGKTGAVKGPITRTGEGVYDLIVYGVKADGEISIVVTKQGYQISPVFQTVTMRYTSNPTSVFNNLADMSAYLQNLPDNTSPSWDLPDPYEIILYGLNMETDFALDGDPLLKLYNAISDRRIILDLRDCTGESLPSIAGSVSHRPNKERLVSVLLPDGITSIGDNAFYGCSSLITITLPESILSIGERAFYNCSSLTTITLPDSLTSIGERAFYWCTSLTTITLPEGLTSINAQVFDHCTSLTTINLPEGLTSIGRWAFDNCTSLTTINLPESITSIDGRAFSNCNFLTLVICNAASPPVTSLLFEWNAFAGAHPGLVIKVPADSVDAYKTAEGWSEYADIIVAID